MDFKRNSIDEATNAYDINSSDQNHIYQPEFMDSEKTTMTSPNVISTSKWAKLFKVELILFIYFCADFPLSICGQRYILSWIKNQTVLKNNSLFNSYYSNELSSSLDPILYQLSKNIVSPYIHQPYIPNYLIENTNFSNCIFNTSSHEYIIQQTIQKLSSEFLILRSVCWTVPAAIFILFIGAVSDLHGRHITILPPLIGQMVNCLTLVIVLYFDLSIFVLLIGDFVAGIGGAYPCLVMGSVAFTFDQCRGVKFFFRITMLQLSILIACSISPLSYGWLIDYFGALPIILSTLISSSISIIYTIILMPREPSTQLQHSQQPSYLRIVRKQLSIAISLVFGSKDPNDCEVIKDIRQPQNYGSIDNSLISNCVNSDVIDSMDKPVTSTIDVVYPLKNSSRDGVRQSQQQNEDENDIADKDDFTQPLIHKPNPILTNKTKLKVLFICYLFAIIPSNDVSVLSLYMMGLPLCWSPTIIGIYFGLGMSLAGAGSLIIAAIVKNRVDNILIGIFSATLFALQRFYLYFIYDTIMMFLGLSVVIFLGLLIPSLKTSMSNLVHPNNQGSLFGCLGCIDVIGFLTSSLVFNMSYSQTLLYSSNFFFLISASMLTVTAFILVIYRIVFGRTTTTEIDVVQHQPAHLS